MKSPSLKVLCYNFSNTIGVDRYWIKWRVAMGFDPRVIKKEMTKYLQHSVVTVNLRAVGNFLVERLSLVKELKRH